MQPVVLWSSQVPWASKFLANLKIWFWFQNVLRLNFLLYLAWKILKDLVSLCLCTNDLLHCLRHDFAIFGWICLTVNYFPTIIWIEKENKVNRADLRGSCFDSTIVNHPNIVTNWHNNMNYIMYYRDSVNYNNLHDFVSVYIILSLTIFFYLSVSIYVYLFKRLLYL